MQALVQHKCRATYTSLLLLGFSRGQAAAGVRAAGSQPEAACAWLLDQLAAQPLEAPEPPASSKAAQQLRRLQRAAEALRLPLVDIRPELGQLAEVQASLQLPAEAVYLAVM